MEFCIHMGLKKYLQFIRIQYISLLPIEESLFNPFTAKFSQKQVSTKFPNFIFVKFRKTNSTKQKSFHLNGHIIMRKISSADSKVKVT